MATQLPDQRPCSCGSGRSSWWEYEARGIALARVCEKCKKQKLSRYQRDVLTDPNYWTDEPIEAD